MTLETRILIAGIGNIFLGDDAFGVAAAQLLAQCNWPPGVEVQDFGIRCLDLAFRLQEGWDCAILLDAVRRDQAPGTVYQIDLDHGDALPAPADSPVLDGHSITVNQVHHLARQLAVQTATSLPPIHLVGCEPQDLEPISDEGGAEPLEVAGLDLAANQIALSAPVAAALPAALALVANLVRNKTAPQPQEVTPA